MADIDILEALQTAHADITGITDAPTAMPGYIDAAHLPMTLCYPGPAEHEGHTFNHLASRREWVVRLYVQKVGAGKGVDEGFQATVPFLDRFLQAYATITRKTWASACGLSYLSDSGVTTLGLHGIEEGDQYWGVVFRLQSLVTKEGA